MSSSRLGPGSNVFVKKGSVPAVITGTIGKAKWQLNLLDEEGNATTQMTANSQQLRKPKPKEKHPLTKPPVTVIPSEIVTSVVPEGVEVVLNQGEAPSPRQDSRPPRRKAATQLRRTPPKYRSPPDTTASPVRHDDSVNAMTPLSRHDEDEDYLTPQTRRRDEDEEYEAESSNASD